MVNKRYRNAALMIVALLPILALLKFKIPRPAWSNELIALNVVVDENNRQRIESNIDLYKNDVNIIDYKLLLIRIEKEKMLRDEGHILVDWFQQQEFHLNKEKERLLSKVKRLERKLNVINF